MPSVPIDLTEEELAALREAVEYHLKRWPNEDYFSALSAALQKIKDGHAYLSSHNDPRR